MKKKTTWTKLPGGPKATYKGIKLDDEEIKKITEVAEEKVWPFSQAARYLISLGLGVYRGNNK